MNEEHKKMIIELAKLLSEDVYQKCLEQIQKINNKWTEYLNERKQEFLASAFLD
jgi:hypothetical protein